MSRVTDMIVVGYCPGYKGKLDEQIKAMFLEYGFASVNDHQDAWRTGKRLQLDVYIGTFNGYDRRKLLFIRDMLAGLLEPWYFNQWFLVLNHEEDMTRWVPFRTMTAQDLEEWHDEDQYDKPIKNNESDI